MCGILGICSSVLPESKVIKNSLDTIKHRGPDDEGYLFIDTSAGGFIPASGPDTCYEYMGKHKDIVNIDSSKYHLVLASRRLAIIDLSHRGHQPMYYDNGDLWITYNGEIFNYKKLRLELQAAGHRFFTDTDTEVVLAAYSKWGEECVNRFNGQWAFCIYDKIRKRLFCSRDRFGIKPFYYYFDGKHFAFASEIKALLKMPFIKRELNKSIISELVLFSMLDHTDETLYTGICQLLPSYNLIVDVMRMNVETKKYYELNFIDEYGKYDHKLALEYADNIRDLLIDSVKLRLESNVPVGTCLSGGLDSSSLVMIINKLLKEGTVNEANIGEKQKTFTASYHDPSVDEKMYADEIISHTNVDGYFVYPTGEDLWKDLDTVLLCQDELGINFYSGWRVSHVASNHVKVLLNGQGGDEVFGGYPSRYEPIYLAETIRAMHFGDLFKFLSEKISDYDFRHLLNLLLIGCYSVFVPKSLEVLLYKARSRDKIKTLQRITGFCLDKKSFDRVIQRGKSLNYILWRDVTRDYIPKLLHYDDRNASAFSIEDRAPFLDHRLVEYMFSIPSVYKLHRGWTKWLLRLSMRNLLPEKILWRKNKVCFGSPELTWIGHKDSPIPSLMNRYGIKNHNNFQNHFIWSLYLSVKLMTDKG